MQKHFLASVLNLLFSSAHAQDIPVVDIDLASVCESPEKISRCEETEIGQLGSFQKKLEDHQLCDSVKELAKQNLAPLNLELKDESGNPWKIRFHFGFTRNNYRPTDLKLESTRETKTIKGFQFDERTSATHYNPANWKEPVDALRWIDEPTNSFTISIENKKNVIYLTAFHPKTLATYYQGKDGQGQDIYIKAPASAYLSNNPALTVNSIPAGYSAMEIQNTRGLMNYSVGYGRKLQIFDSQKAGKLNYIVRVDVGAMVGAAKSFHFTEDREFSEGKDKTRIQSGTIALGHRLEYQKGKVGVFVEQKYTKTKMEHAFLDGKASYNLDFSTLNFGVSIDLFTKRK